MFKTAHTSFKMVKRQRDMWKAPFFSTIHPLTCSFHRLLIITVIISLNHFAFFFFNMCPKFAKTVQLPWATVFVRRRTRDMTTGETCVRVPAVGFTQSADVNKVSTPFHWLVSPWGQRATLPYIMRPSARRLAGLQTSFVKLTTRLVRQFSSKYTHVWLAC